MNNINDYFGKIMNRRNTLKTLAVASAILSFLPPFVYYICNAKTLHADKNIVKLSELYILFALTLIAFVSHVGVSFVSTSVGLGAAFFMVSLFVQITVVVALVMFYKAARYTDYNANQSEVGALGN
jgi:hypothetical protein